MSPQFVVADLERSINFYTQTLGFELDFRYEDFYAGITRSGYSIHLKLGDPDVEEIAKRCENEHLHLSFSVEDIHSLFDAIKSSGLSIIQPLREMPYGTEFYIADPDSYLLGFLEEK